MDEPGNTLEQDGEADKTTNPLKRKRPEPTKDNAKLQEYLGLMTAPSKMKTWRDGEQPPVDAPEPASTQQTSAEQIAPETANETPVLPWKKSARSPDSDEEADRPPAVKARKTAEAPPADVEDGQNSAQGPPPGTSDMDWMRSRTSRLLGLVTDDVEDSDQEDQERKGPRAESPDLEKGGAKVKISAEDSAAIKVDENAELSGASPVELEEEVSAEVATIRKTGRLFLRNLAYTITEDEIREYLSAFPSLEEVSYHPRLQHFIHTSKG